MDVQFDESDDPEVLRLFRDYAKSIRRRGTPEQAPTASKIEIAFSKALESSPEASAATAGRD